VHPRDGRGVHQEGRDDLEVDLARLADGLRTWQSHLNHRTVVENPHDVRPPSVGAPTRRRVIKLIEPVPGYPSFSLPANGPDGDLGWDAPLTERIDQDTIELWHIVNTTGDTHPIHLHLVQFRVVARYAYDDVQLTQSNSVVPAGPLQRPEPGEDGWKDVVRCNPGTVTQIVAAFDLPGHYMYHCHILEHEDAGMMRPFVVLPHHP
jgi:FtsP/CotA-like multicopper oxidase with cupredoxin domain